MKERIKQICKLLKRSPTEFANDIGINRNTLYMVESGSRAMPDKYLQKICELWPEISYEWLKLGKGEPPILNLEAVKTMPPSPVNNNYPPQKPQHLESAARLKAIMKAKDFTQEEFGEYIEIGQPYVSSLMSGRRGIGKEVASKIIRAFPEVSLDWLMHGKGAFPDFMNTGMPIFSEPAPPYPKNPSQQQSLFSQNEPQKVLVISFTTPKGRTIKVYEGDKGVSLDIE